tara:strand:- start:1042 stop:1254 length:213 start_codon:yes stop_codon:yes gene_type:complete
MKDLIEALQILLKYANDDRDPTHCEHDQLYVGCGISYESVTKKDIDKLDKLGFFWDEDLEGFISFRFGSR